MRLDVTDNQNQHLTKKKQTSKRLLFPSLILSNIAIGPPALIASLLLIDIGITFGQPVGVIGQIRTVTSLVGMVFAVFMGVWSVRFEHRWLLLLGLMFLGISAFGCFSALNFFFLLTFYAISGLGEAMAGPMTYTLVGEHFPLEQRTSIIGRIGATGALVGIIGPPVVVAIAGLGGWRWTFLLFALPLALLSLTMVAKGVPSFTQASNLQKRQNQYWDGFKAVIANRSTMAFLMGIVLLYAGFIALHFYSISYFREYFLISIRWASILLISSALSFILGSLSIGRFIPRFGRVPITVSLLFIIGILTITYMNIRFLGLSVVLWLLGGLFFGMLMTTYTSLLLEQIPKYRGTMTSLEYAAGYLGDALGAAIGGLMLLWFDYETLGLVLGGMFLAAALIFYLFVIDPTKIES